MLQKLRGLKRRLSLLTQSKAERRHGLVGPSDLWEMKRRFQINFLRTYGLTPENYLVDIGCGTLRGGICFIEYLEPGHYYGLEVRNEVLEEGKKELEEYGLLQKTPVLKHSPDISKIDLERKFDFLWAFSVLIHMNDDILKDTIDFVSRHIKDYGVFFANVNIGTDKEGTWQGFPVVKRPYEFYNNICKEKKLTMEDIGSLREVGHTTGSDRQDKQRMLRISKTLL